MSHGDPALLVLLATAGVAVWGYLRGKATMPAATVSPLNRARVDIVRERLLDWTWLVCRRPGDSGGPVSMVSVRRPPKFHPTLRQLGLKDVIVKDGDGYRFAPGTRVVSSRGDG